MDKIADSYTDGSIAWSSDTYSANEYTEKYIEERSTEDLFDSDDEPMSIEEV